MAEKKTLQQLRQERNETVQEVARACGISVSAVRAYEIQARIPRDPIRILMSKHFGVDLGDIIF